MNEQVYIFDIWRNPPRYHDYGSTTETSDLTKCGLVIYGDRRKQYYALLKRAQADQFAAPCRRCFPTASEVPA